VTQVANIFRRKISGKDNGQALVEFAFVFPILIAVLIGVIYVSIVFYSFLTVQLAVREGASAIVHNPTYWAQEGLGCDINCYIRSRCFALVTDPSKFLITITPPKNQWAMNIPVYVQAIYYIPLPNITIPFPGGGKFQFGEIPIKASSQMTID
jgi:hypothetical protein